MYIDKELSFFEKLDKKKNFKNSLFVLFGDHGLGRDLNRDKKMLNELGLRAYYEHLNIPIIISPFKKKPLIN